LSGESLEKTVTHHQSRKKVSIKTHLRERGAKIAIEIYVRPRKLVEESIREGECQQRRNQGSASRKELFHRLEKNQGFVFEGVDIFRLRNFLPNYSSRLISSLCQTLDAL
jgi:hypothetical protein